MTIKEITCYQNDDGKIWTTLAQAEFWEIVMRKVVKSPAKESETVYNMHNEGYEDHCQPVGRD